MTKPKPNTGPQTIEQAIIAALHAQVAVTRAYGHASGDRIQELETQLDAAVASVLGMFTELETKVETLESQLKFAQGFAIKKDQPK